MISGGIDIVYRVYRAYRTHEITGEGRITCIGNREVHFLADLDSRHAEVEPLLEDHVLQLRVGL